MKSDVQQVQRGFSIFEKYDTRREGLPLRKKMTREDSFGRFGYFNICLSIIQRQFHEWFGLE